MTVCLSLKNLTKSYPSGFTLGPLSLTLNQGSCLGVLGHNGAGKSSLFEIITGNLDATSGQVLFLEQPLVPESVQLKKQIGYLPQNFRFPVWATPKDILRYAAALYEIESPAQRIKAQLAFWDCQSFAHRPIIKCSHGMQKRVGLALASLHHPALMILDEPFSGLDLGHVKTLLEFIEQCTKNGQTIILSTHVMSYVARLCHDVILLTQGQISTLPDWAALPTAQRTERLERHFFS